MSEGHKQHRVRLLLFFIGAGAGVFVFGLWVPLTLISVWGTKLYDSSVLNFYPIVAGLGALFGFSLWWSYEVGGDSGGVNPFHDR